ncbi:hypothetical protein [Bdellovibrio bacteriovorus]|uniref:hypothetical protein n=1 Tax=Bdellovibrio bacteriovorus TaxID=959 RepID=UPI0035A91461
MWTIQVPQSSFAQTYRKNNSIDFTVKYWKSARKVEERLSTALVENARFASEVLTAKGVKGVEIEIATSKNARGNCGSCGLILYLFPETSTRTLEIIWYDTTGNTPKIIYSQSAEWKTDTWFFYFPVVIPASLKAGFSDENKNYSFFEKLSGTPEIDQALIDLNNALVNAVIENKSEYLQSLNSREYTK